MTDEHKDNDDDDDDTSMIEDKCESIRITRRILWTINWNQI